MWQCDRSQFCCFCLTTVSLLAQLELSHGLAPSMTNEHEAIRTQDLYCNIGRTQSPTPLSSTSCQIQSWIRLKRKVALRFLNPFPSASTVFERRFWQNTTNVYPMDHNSRLISSSRASVQSFPLVYPPQWLHCLRWGHGNPNFPATGSHSKPGLNVEHIITWQLGSFHLETEHVTYNLNSFYSSTSKYTFHELFRSRSGNTATSTKEHHPGSSGHPCCGPWSSTQWTRHVWWPPRWHL